MLLLIAAPLLGAAVVLCYLSVTSGDGTMHWLGLGITGSIFLTFHVIFTRMRRLAAKAVRNGYGGVARLDSVTAGGATDSDGDPLQNFEYTVALDRGQVFRHNFLLTRPLSGEGLPGEITPVAQLNPLSPAIISLRGRVQPRRQQLTRLPAPGMAPTWQPDLTTPNLAGGWNPEWASALRPRHLLVHLLATVLFCAGGAAATLMHRELMRQELGAPAPTAPVGPATSPADEDDNPAPAPSPDKPILEPYTTQGITTILAEFARMAGTKETVQVVLYPTHAAATMPIAAGSSKFDVYRYHPNLGFEHEGPATIQPRPEHDGRFSLDDIPAATVSKVIAGAEKDAGLPDGETTHAIASKPLFGRHPGRITIRVYVSADYSQPTMLTYDLSGKLLLKS